MLIRDGLRLLMRHWPALVALAAGGLIVREVIVNLAVPAGRWSAVAGLLVLAVAPLSAMLITVAMLLIMRDRETVDHRAVLASIGSMIIPFLVVYEHYGTLEEDQRDYYSEARRDIVDIGVTSGTDGGSRVPEGASLAVLGTVAGALIVRTVATRLSERANGRYKTALQVIAGYCEGVWIFLGVFVITLGWGRAEAWLHSRVVTHAITDWWDDVTARLPAVDLAIPGLGLVVSGLLVGVVVPISWLAVGAIVYGTRAADVVRVGETRVGQQISNRIGTEATERAWRFSVDPERRFGPLFGGLGLIRRSGAVFTLTFCLAYVVVSLGGYVVWGIARSIAGPQSGGVWTALATPLEGISSIVVQVLTAVLLAAGANQLTRDHKPVAAGSSQ